MNGEVEVSPELLSEVRKYGEFDVKGCYACGSCTVICSLSEDKSPLPRRCIRFAQIGAKEPLRESLEPWLCYYCGDCSTSCPRQTEPGEAMMTLRRYLTAQYDWTGLSRKFYKSPVWEILAIFLTAIFILFVSLHFLGGEMLIRGIKFNTLPGEKVHIFDMTLGGVLTLLIFINVARMWWLTIGQSKIKVPFQMYFIEFFKTLLFHAVSQVQLLKCKVKNEWEKNLSDILKGRWMKHWLLASGYVLMFALIMGFPGMLLKEELLPIYIPHRLLGYYATVVLIIFSIEIIISRFRKKEQIHKFSDFGDWLFPILLLLTTVSGIGVHIFKGLRFYDDSNFITYHYWYYWTYIIHLMIAVPMLVIEVPFGKWAHLYYRPLAIFFYTIREKALQMQMGKEV